MTKKEIMDQFCDIDVIYNDSTRLETLSRMIDELMEHTKPLPIEIEGGGSTWWYVCPECHGAVDTWDRFCKHCGQALRADEKRDPDGHPEEDEPDYP